MVSDSGTFYNKLLSTIATAAVAYSWLYYKNNTFFKIL